jgi:hypothetical protein
MIWGIPLWKLGTAIGIVLTLMGSCALRDHKLRKEGAERVVATSKIEGKKNADKARKAHERARTPGAAERLLKDSCRDC